jgi:ABC-2 type transport system permease protein
VNTTANLWWLLRHEWRLQLRESPSSRWLLWSALGVVVLGFAGAFFARSLVAARGVAVLPETLPVSALVFFTLGALLLFSIVVSLSVRNAVQTLFERGDVDLLLSSPLDARLVLASRGLWVFVSSFLALSVFVVPLTLGAVVFLGWRLLGVLPLLASLSLLGAGVGLLVTLALVRWLGARRARTVAQVVGVFFGAGFYLVTQLGRFINTDNIPWLGSLLENVNSLPSSSAWFIPARAALFEPLPTLVMLIVGAGVFAFSVQFMHRAFLTGMTSSVTGGRVKTNGRIKSSKFQQNFFLNVMRKEWRLIARDPMLISQTLLQLVYFIPMLLVFFGSSSSQRDFLSLTGLFPVLAFAAVFLGGSLAQNLTQIVVGAEDAPELLRMSPANGWQIRWAKLIAAITPAWLLFTPLILWRATVEPRSLIIFVPFTAVTVLGGLIMLWAGKPFARADLMKQRRGNQNWVVGVSLLVLDAAWLAAVLAPGWWAASSVLVGLVIPLLFWLFSRDQNRLGY